MHFSIDLQLCSTLFWFFVLCIRMLFLYCGSLYARYDYFFLVSAFLFCSTYFCSGFLGFSPTGRDFLLISGAVAVQDQRAKSFDMALLSPVDLYKKKK